MEAPAALPPRPRLPFPAPPEALVFPHRSSLLLSPYCAIRFAQAAALCGLAVPLACLPPGPSGARPLSAARPPGAAGWALRAPVHPASSPGLGGGLGRGSSGVAEADGRPLEHPRPGRASRADLGKDVGNAPSGLKQTRLLQGPEDWCLAASLGPSCWPGVGMFFIYFLSPTLF